MYRAAAMAEHGTRGDDYSHGKCKLVPNAASRRSQDGWKDEEWSSAHDVKTGESGASCGNGTEYEWPSLEEVESEDYDWNAAK